MLRDRDRLSSALAAILPGQAPISGVSPLTTGFSNDTYLVEGPDLILRLPPAAGAMVDGHGVIAQARIYRALGALAGGPPVPRVVHIGDCAEPLGAPFFVMERVAGEAVSDIDLQDWFTQASDAMRARMSMDWVAAFAALARLAPLDVLGPPVSPEDDLHKWQRFAGAANSPRLVDQIDRLLRTPAPLSGPASVVHGDPKLSNLMWQDWRISAMLDWEMALNSDPLADLGYMLYLLPSPFHEATRAPKLPGMIGRDEAIAAWERVSGRSAAGVMWHEIAQIAKICAIIAEGVNMHETGRSQDPKLAWFKINQERYLATIDAMLAAGGF